MKGILRFILGAIEILVIVFAIFMVSVVFMRNDYGYTQFGSNTLIVIDDENITELTHFTSGDLVVVKNVTYNDINVGDELYYYDTLNEQYIIRTGIVATKTGDNRSALYTFEEDTSVSISSDRIIGVYNTSYSSWGKVLSFLESTIGFLIFVILPILLLFIYQVYRLILILKYDKD